jgi:DNA-binding NarL/FixJ family response regulator
MLPDRQLRERRSREWWKESFMPYTHVDNRQYSTVVTEAHASIASASVAGAQQYNIPATDESRSTQEQKSTDIISVLLVDDHTLIREGLRQLLALEQDLLVIGEAADGPDALQKIRQLQPDVVLMDVQMPIIDGITLTRQITQEFPTVAVIILTIYQQDQKMLQAMKNGARGYLLKSASVREVTQAIRKVHAGEVFIKPELTRAIVSEFRRLSDSSAADQGADMLSLKEIEIIRYVAAGLSNKEIAEKLAYSEKTVKNYLSIIFQKLHLRDRTQVAIFALRQGLLSDEEL